MSQESLTAHLQTLAMASVIDQGLASFGARLGSMEAVLDEFPEMERYEARALVDLVGEALDHWDTLADALPGFRDAQS